MKLLADLAVPEVMGSSFFDSPAADWSVEPPWQTLSRNHVHKLTAWDRENLAEFVDLERHVCDVLSAGIGIAHGDVSESSILIDRNGFPRIVGWTWAARSPTWVDAAVVIVRLVEAGCAPEEAENIVSAVPAWAEASPASLNAFAVALLGCWILSSRQPSLTDAARWYAQYRLYDATHCAQGDMTNEVDYHALAPSAMILLLPVISTAVSISGSWFIARRKEKKMNADNADDTVQFRRTAELGKPLTVDDQTIGRSSSRPGRHGARHRLPGIAAPQWPGGDPDFPDRIRNERGGGRDRGRALDKFDDSLLGQHSGPTRVVLSTYVDFQSWAMNDHLGIPDAAQIAWDRGRANADSMMSVRASALAINKQSHGATYAGIDAGKKAGDAQTAWREGTTGVDRTAADDAKAVYATFGIVGDYIAGNEVAASDCSTPSLPALLSNECRVSS
ncbi:hypothetical protein SAMN05421854_1196 [Amycolatopsis rubida]|uniref:Aminoglycoside phosphotransferase domain-containing protein n=1 Tax=Amycolatopsis rubida TaxID=112413 RepID=A0A1I6AH61_9PSEU|nr:hypothetical protein SAMN05421854_1196 [Amycolatopsis rubida]